MGRIAYIYKITNPKNKIYIGSTVNYKRRFAQYRSEKSTKHQHKLFNSLKKYGYNNHKFEIVCQCDESERNEKEKYFGVLYNVLDRESGLNIRLPKSEDGLPCFSEELRKKISERSKTRVGPLNPAWGKKRPDFVAMVKARDKTGKNNPNYGKSMKPHVKEKLKLARKKLLEQGIHPMNKIVIDINTGVFYDSAMQVIKLYGFKKSTFVSMLNGRKKNTTQFRYA